MFTGLSVLIVEDEALVALDLATAVEDLDGVAVTTHSVAEGLKIVATRRVSAAVIDAYLPDGEVTPLALALRERGVPFVVHSGDDLPRDLDRLAPDLILVTKPTASAIVLNKLHEICCGGGV